MTGYIKIDHVGETAKEYLNVNWCLTSICNFKCSYCPESLHDGKVPGIKSDIVIETITTISEHFSDKKIFFEFTGGEVTYYKNFLDVVKHVKSLGHDVGIISNGKRELSYWEKIRDHLDHICLSYHSEDKYADHFEQVAKYLKEKVTTHVNVMMLPENFDHCMKLATAIANIGDVSIALQPLYLGMRGEKYNYTDEQEKAMSTPIEELPGWKGYSEEFSKSNKVYRGAMAFTKENGDVDVLNTPEILAKKLNNWKGWACYAGLENLVIDFYGNIKRAWCGAPGTDIGNILGVYELPSKPVLCRVTNCHCGFDMMCTKKKIEDAG